MPDRAKRIRWSVRHRQTVAIVEKVGSGLVLVLGATMAYFGSGLGQYTGIGLASLGVWGFFPSARPLISDIVDRIPMLAKKTDEGPRIED